ncbi:MAG: ATP-dependent Clp protease proteolytic subunit, partial [Bacteroidota bacterium]|nr:ATP-dependent Clp protease proteolytic subunit [Bacteroidota bacterium]
MEIRNSGEKTVIDIIGKEIGESWFDEGFTASQLQEQIKGVEDIEINLNSLGGDLNEALVIYDLLKLHPHNVTVNLLGANASASTVIALGAKKE